MKSNTTQAGRTVKLAIALACSVFVAACGGGGGSSSTSGSTTAPASAPTTSTTTTTLNATDPYTGQPATGTATQQISGSVVSGPTTGATVTAYVLNADGTNGNAIGAVVTDSTGAFTMTLTQAPAGMVRLVATGGTFTSEADQSTQKNVTLELVAPYVTTSLNTFVITPVTYYASQRINVLLKQGQSLPNAYRIASSAALQFITGTDSIHSNDRTHSGIDYLSIVPGSAQDNLNAYSDGLTGLEYYGVKYDLPSHTAVRILVTTAMAGNGTTNVNGQPVNVGQWSGSTFDETLPLDVTTMGLHSAPEDDVVSIVQQMNGAQACASGDHTAYYQRFPLATGTTDYLDANTCTVFTNNTNAIKAKISTNNRSKFIS